MRRTRPFLTFVCVCAGPWETKAALSLSLSLCVSLSHRHTHTHSLCGYFCAGPGESEAAHVPRRVQEPDRVAAAGAGRLRVARRSAPLHQPAAAAAREHR